MWGNLGAITRVVGNAIENVQKAASELENQMDAAVGDEPVLNMAMPAATSPPPQPKTKAKKEKAKISEPMKEETPTILIEEPIHTEKSNMSYEYEESNDMTTISMESPAAIPKGYIHIDDMDRRIKELHDEHAVTLDFALKQLKEAKEVEISTMRHDMMQAQDMLQQQTISSNDKVATMKKKHAAEIAKLRSEIEALKTSLLSSAAETSSPTSSSSETENDHVIIIQQLQASLLAANHDIDVMRDEIAMLTDHITAKDTRIYDHESAITRLKDDYGIIMVEHEQSNKKLHDKSSILVQLEQDVVKLKEIINDRERALGSVSQAMAEAQSHADHHVQRIHALEAEVADKDAKMKQMQTSSSVSDNDAKKMVVKLQEVLKEKEERLAAFEAEGQSLAKRQSEMEKAVRKAKGEAKEKETEILKLKESKEQLVKVIEELQESCRKSEADTANAMKSLNAMQAVSAASSEKLSKLEAELSSKIEELNTQKRALETAWGEVNELKRLAVELRAERDDARRQLESGVSRVMETESSRRDVEQREAVLRATNKQLQESLQRQMQETSSREERLRDEVHEMRKRWQEAISSRESVSHELSAATAPLLRQISSLQEAIRVKSDHFQSIESSLSEKAMKAEAMVMQAETRKQLLEDQHQTLTKQVNNLNNKLSAAQASIDRYEDEIRTYKTSESKLQAAIEQLEHRYLEEMKEKNMLASKVEDVTITHRRDLQQIHDQHSILLQQKEAMITKLETDVDHMRSSIASKEQLLGIGSPPAKNHRDSPTMMMNDHHLHMKSPLIQFASISLPSGDTSFAVAERVEQQLQQRNEEASSLLHQLRQIQMARDALLEEVNYLSSRNAQLEEDVATLPSLQEQLSSIKVKNEVLLTMLGEKEEELEGVLADMKEVKNLYRHELDNMLDKIAPTTTTIISATQ